MRDSHAQADADDEAALKAILAGLKRRHEKTGDVPHLIHTVRVPSHVLLLCLLTANPNHSPASH